MLLQMLKYSGWEEHLTLFLKWRWRKTAKDKKKNPHRLAAKIQGQLFLKEIKILVEVRMAFKPAVKIQGQLRTTIIIMFIGEVEGQVEATVKWYHKSFAK